MRAPAWVATLGLVLLSLVALSAAQRCREERYLPVDLAAFPSLALTGELHVHGRFRANMTEANHDIAFTVINRSYFRAYLAPESMDIDLYLFKGHSRVEVVRRPPLPRPPAHGCPTRPVHSS